MVDQNIVFLFDLMPQAGIYYKIKRRENKAVLNTNGLFYFPRLDERFCESIKQKTAKLKKSSLDQKLHFPPNPSIIVYLCLIDLSKSLHYYRERY